LCLKVFVDEDDMMCAFAGEVEGEGCADDAPADYDGSVWGGVGI
jgi:hypothetical protein